MYATAESLIAKYGASLLINLTVKEPDGSETGPDLAVMDREIGRTDGVIDGYLRQRYALPLPEVPAELAGYAEDLVIARLYGCIPERTVPEDVSRAAREAVAWLRDIQKGLASLSVASLVPAPSADGQPGFIKVSKRREDRLFDDRTLDTFTGR